MHAALLDLLGHHVLAGAGEIGDVEHGAVRLFGLAVGATRT